MIDIGFSGSHFTWTNKPKFNQSNQTSNKLIMERLDKFCATNAWINLFQHSTVKHLPRTHSHHCPLLLNLTKPFPKSISSFKFEIMWLQHPEFHHLVTETWLNQMHYPTGLKHLRTYLPNGTYTVLVIYSIKNNTTC